MFTKKALAASVSAAPAVYVEDVFSTFLYTGNGSTQTITNGIDLAGEGGLVWFKRRDTTGDNTLTDTVNNGRLISNSTNALNTNALVSSFDADGFSLNTSLTPNQNAATYCSWTFRKAAKFFDVVTYTGNGSNRTIAHNLGSVPGCIIVKRTDTTGDWQVYHRSLANTEYLVLNSTAAKTTGTTRWNSTTPTSTVFSLGTDATVNASGGTYVAYLFAHDAGGFGDAGTDNVVSCGNLTGSGAGNTTTVTLGWEPQWILAKRTDATQNWVLFDNMRGLDYSNAALLRPNLSDSESVSNSTGYFRPTPTGFIYGPDNFMGDTAQIIYIAIRRGPMKTPMSGTEVFFAGTAANYDAYNVGFPTDAFILGYRAGSSENAAFMSRLTGIGYLASSKTQQEFTFGGTRFDLQNLFDQNATSTSTSRYNFRRAPGFFDVVAYTSSGSSPQTISHNLGVTPQLIIAKQRNSTSNWMGVTSVAGSSRNNFSINLVDAFLSLGNLSTATAFTFSSRSLWDVEGTITGEGSGAGALIIAYLFATCPGVSKVGSYTGTGTTLDIDCGFTAGSRFVMIKRTDTTGDWYVWDTARGIVSGNDSYLLLNSTAAEVTNTDYIDPLSSGFQISSTAPAAINASGGTYIYLSIA